MLIDERMGRRGTSCSKHTSTLTDTLTHTHIEECTYSDAARLVATYGLCLVVSTKIEAAKTEPEGKKGRRRLEEFLGQSCTYPLRRF